MIAVRPAHPADAGAIAAIYGAQVLGGIASFETQPPDAGEIAARMAASNGLYPWLVATTADAEVIGFAYASAFHPREAYRWTVETTVYVADAGQRQGTGRRLLAALVDILAAQSFAQAIARIALPNPGSVALHEAMGFAHAGVLRAVGHKQDRWIDVGLWQRALTEPARPPGEPRHVATIGTARDRRGGDLVPSRRGSPAHNKQSRQA